MLAPPGPLEIAKQESSHQSSGSHSEVDSCPASDSGPFETPLQTWGLEGSRSLSPVHCQAPPCSEKLEPSPAERLGLFRDQGTPILLGSDSQGPMGEARSLSEGPGTFSPS